MVTSIANSVMSGASASSCTCCKKISSLFLSPAHTWTHRSVPTDSHFALFIQVIDCPLVVNYSSVGLWQTVWRASFSSQL